jgi:hypothetical protein
MSNGQLAMSNGQYLDAALISSQLFNVELSAQLAREN